jgi:diaminopimelate decarboxylase
MIHTGADLFLRECLNPKDWHHEYSVLDKKGNLKTGKDVNPYNLAGPLCFSGDILAKNVSLPVIEEGDWIIIHDTGGYTFGMWSRYNSRQTPRVLGYTGDKFEIIKERESFSALEGFWK